MHSNLLLAIFDSVALKRPKQSDRALKFLKEYLSRLRFGIPDVFLGIFICVFDIWVIKLINTAAILIKLKLKQVLQLIRLGQLDLINNLRLLLQTLLQHLYQPLILLTCVQT